MYANDSYHEPSLDAILSWSVRRTAQERVPSLPEHRDA